MKFPIVDLHCDLLFYLGIDPHRTAHDKCTRCAIPQLRTGNVKLQTLAVFTETHPHSVEKGLNQVKIFQALPIHYPKDLIHYTSACKEEPSQIALMLAFENASGFCSEQEPLKEGFHRLRKLIAEVSKPLYVSLTWNSENRFGGGAKTNIGLKEDGKRLVDELHEQNIAIDLSHTSDALAYDILDYIEGKGMNLPVMASHSNARTILDVPRNLPDEIGKEIFRRKGMLGINFIRNFLGNDEECLINHFAHWLELGGENHLGFGADFYHEADLPPVNPGSRHGSFFDAFQNSSCYPSVQALLQKSIGLSEEILEKISSQNALAFIQNIFSCNFTSEM